jgi:hypothetical protein
MQTVYLKDGTKANLIAKTDKGYVVDPINVYQDYESDEEYEDSTGEVKMVDKVYEKPPIEVIEEEYKQILQKVDEQEKLLKEKTSELTRIKFELAQLTQQKTDAAKMIFNRSELANAKRLIVWIKDRIIPRIMDNKGDLKLNISYKISRYKTEERCWASAWCDYNDNWSSYSEYFDEKYGVKADLTDEEILQITFERQEREIFDEREIEMVDEKWLTPKNIDKKKAYIERSNINALKAAERDLKAAQEKLDKLKEINGLVVS